MEPLGGGKSAVSSATGQDGGERLGGTIHRRRARLTMSTSVSESESRDRFAARAGEAMHKVDRIGNTVVASLPLLRAPVPKGL